MPKTKPITLPNQELNTTNMDRIAAAPVGKIGLPLNTVNRGYFVHFLPLLKLSCLTQPLDEFFLAELGTSEACFLNLNLFFNTNFKDGREDPILLHTKLPQYWGNFVHFFNLD